MRNVGGGRNKKRSRVRRTRDAKMIRGVLRGKAQGRNANMPGRDTSLKRSKRWCPRKINAYWRTRETKKKKGGGKKIHEVQCPALVAHQKIRRRQCTV